MDRRGNTSGRLEADTMEHIVLASKAKPHLCLLVRTTSVSQPYTSTSRTTAGFRGSCGPASATKTLIVARRLPFSSRSWERQSPTVWRFACAPMEPTAETMRTSALLICNCSFAEKSMNLWIKRHTLFLSGFRTVAQWRLFELFDTAAVCTIVPLLSLPLWRLLVQVSLANINMQLFFFLPIFGGWLVHRLSGQFSPYCSSTQVREMFFSVFLGLIS